MVMMKWKVMWPGLRTACSCGHSCPQVPGEMAAGQGAQSFRGPAWLQTTHSLLLTRPEHVHPTWPLWPGGFVASHQTQQRERIRNSHKAAWQLPPTGGKNPLAPQAPGWTSLINNSTLRPSSELASNASLGRGAQFLRRNPPCEPGPRQQPSLSAE